MAFGVCSFIVNMMFSVFARANWVLYTGLFFGTHYWCTASMCRSQLSKIVGAYDVGKLYSTLAFTQGPNSIKNLLARALGLKNG